MNSKNIKAEVEDPYGLLKYIDESEADDGSNNNRTIRYRNMYSNQFKKARDGYRHYIGIYNNYYKTLCKEKEKSKL